MDWLYSSLLFLALLIYLPLYVFRLALRRGESLSLGQRLTLRLPARRSRNRALWIHAVSVGEVLSLQNFVRCLKVRHPEWEIYCSTLTNTGFRMAQQKLAAADHIFFVPFDFGWAVRRVFRAIRPSLLVLAESEFWPQLLKQSHREGSRVLLVNGRVSDRSFRRYERLKFLARRLWPHIDRFLVQTDQDRKRLVALGVSEGRVAVSGNLKCDVSLPEFSDREKARLRSRLSIPARSRIIVAGSIREGEDEILLRAFRAARSSRRDVVLIIAPRHIDRALEVERMARKEGLSPALRSEVVSGQKWDVLILDTMGELASLYGLCDLAFIGGSLVPWGGHNILEPAFYGKPILFGPHMHNFAYLAETFRSRGAARVVRTSDELARAFALRDLRPWKAMGQKARRTLGSLQGATDRALAAVEEFMEEA